MSALLDRPLPSFAKPRPLSPHLTVYTPQYTSMLSISHRITGVAMGVYFFVLIVAYKASMNNLACSHEVLRLWKSLDGTVVGTVAHFIPVVCLFAFVFFFFYHLASGLRRLVSARRSSFYDKTLVASRGKRILFWTFVGVGFLLFITYARVDGENIYIALKTAYPSTSR
jgi:succinate dehydrogenase / fumarate reductase cytochrome b subunit